MALFEFDVAGSRSSYCFSITEALVHMAGDKSMCATCTWNEQFLLTYLPRQHFCEKSDGKVDSSARNVAKTQHQFWFPLCGKRDNRACELCLSPVSVKPCLSPI